MQSSVSPHPALLNCRDVRDRRLTVHRPPSAACEWGRVRTDRINHPGRARRRMDETLTVDMEKTTARVPGANATATMVWIPGGEFGMGSDRHYPEERPVHRVSVSGFWIDRSPVTNGELARFVEETGYVTLAEAPPNPADYSGALPEMLYAGSLVFVKPGGPVDQRKIANWWHYVRGADWRHPRGLGSSLAGLERHPVVHIAYQDAVAFARWSGKEL